MSVFRNKSNKQIFTRLAIPAFFTSLFIILLKHKSNSAQNFSRYSDKYLIFLVNMSITAVLSWWIVINKARYLRFKKRVSTYTISSLVVIVVAMLIFFDFLYDVDIIFVFLTTILVFVVFLLSRKNFRKSSTQLAKILLLIIIGITITEILLKIFLFKNVVPKTEREFQKIIASTWPRNVLVKKDSGTFRILGLADSFGVAGGEKNYHYFLESLFQNEGVNFEVVNISHPGYELYDELKIYRDFGVRYKPDIVLHGFYVGNDFDPIDRDLLTFEKVWIRKVKGLRNFRPHNFYIVNWLRNYIKILQEKEFRESEIVKNDPQGTLSKKTFLEKELLQMNVICRFDNVSNTSWKKALEMLDVIRSEVKKQGAKYAIVIHPDQFQVEDDLGRQIEETYNIKFNLNDCDVPQKLLINYCLSRKIPCIDLLPIFRKEGSKGGLFKFRDTHYNEKGNKLAAEEIYQFIKEQGLIDN